MVYKLGEGWALATTDLISTNPDVTFRDTKGRFKSTDDYSDLTDQLKVNRFIANELDAQAESLAKEAEMRRTKDEFLQEQIDAISEEEVDLSGYAKRQYVDRKSSKALSFVLHQIDWSLQTKSSGSWIFDPEDTPEIQRYNIGGAADMASVTTIQVHALGSGEFIHQGSESIGDLIHVYSGPDYFDVDGATEPSIPLAFGIYEIAGIERFNWPDEVEGEYTDAYTEFTVTPRATYGAMPENDLSNIKTTLDLLKEINTLADSLAEESKQREEGDQSLQNQIDNINESGYDDTAIWEALNELPVTVATDPPEIKKDGELWYDDERLELFVSYQDGWISTTPLTARVEAGEALQAEILARVEAGEIKQATIETNAMTKGGPQTLTDDKWSIKDNGGATYAMISDGEITMYHVAEPDAPKQPTNKEYVDNADKKMQADISNLEAKVIELEGSIGEHRFIYNNEQNNPEGRQFCLQER